MINPNDNPDMPVLSGAGFEQYTYQPYQQQIAQQQYYYNGSSVTPVAQPADPYSRRYDAAPQVAPQFAPPASVPAVTPQQPTYGFNQLAESRRNILPVQQPVAQPTVNPWSVQQAALQVPQAIPMPNVPVQAPVYPMAPTMAPLQNYSWDLSINKKSPAWENPTVYSPHVVPNVNWSAAQIPAPAQNSYQQVAYPSAWAQPTMQTDWLQYAQQNFPK